MLADISMADAMGTPPRTIMAKYLLKRAMEIWRNSSPKPGTASLQTIELQTPVGGASKHDKAHHQQHGSQQFPQHVGNQELVDGEHHLRQHLEARCPIRQKSEIAAG